MALKLWSLLLSISVLVIDRITGTVYTFCPDGKVVVPCKYDIPENMIHFLQWVKGGSIIALYEPGTIPDPESTDYVLNEEHALVITNSSLGYAGTYTCVVASLGAELDYTEDIDVEFSRVACPSSTLESGTSTKSAHYETATVKITTPEREPQPENNTGTNQTNATVGSVIGVVFGLLIICSIIVCVVKKIHRCKTEGKTDHKRNRCSSLRNYLTRICPAGCVHRLTSHREFSPYKSVQSTTGNPSGNEDVEINAGVRE